MFVDYQNRIPLDATVIVVSNHRSFMDALILIQAVQKPLRIACHYYMGQVPLLRELVFCLGCFPLAKPNQKGRRFLKQGSQILANREWLGIFPEGAKPMVKLSAPGEVGEFESGFAHLALRAQIDDLVILPVAIAPQQEKVQGTFPLELLRLFDPEEPLFTGSDGHPVVIYQRVNVFIGHPYRITPQEKAAYKGQQRIPLANSIADYCRQEIITLLK